MRGRETETDWERERGRQREIEGKTDSWPERDRHADRETVRVRIEHPAGYLSH